MALNQSEGAMVGEFGRLDDNPTYDVAAIAKEVENGLPNERIRISEAMENQAFYDLEGDRYAPRREAEIEFDFVGRPACETGFTQEVVNVLCEHQYSCGPARKAEDPTADEFLQKVYEQVHIDAVMHEAEVLSTLNDVAAIEVKCTNDLDNPIELRLWGSEEYAIFVSPDDPCKPIAVVTIDRVNEQTRYRLWLPDVVRTFVTKPYSATVTAGARLASELPEEPNTYGCLPFRFVPYSDQVRRFWTPGLGTFLRKTEIRANARLSEMDEQAGKYATPIGVFVNVSPDFNPEIGRGRFIRLYSSPSLDGEGGFAPGGQPDVKYLQSELNFDQQWLDVTNKLNQALEAARVPASAVRMDQAGATSGIQIIAEQAPLLTRARSRRPMFIRVETELARLILTVAGNHYDRPELVTAAKTLRLLMSWPETQIPIPGPDRDNHDEWELRMGIASRLQLVMQRRGMTRDQAVAYLKQVKKDEDDADVIDPPPEAPDLEEPGGDGKTGLKTETKGA